MRLVIVIGSMLFCFQSLAGGGPYDVAVTSQEGFQVVSGDGVGLWARGEMEVELAELEGIYQEDDENVDMDSNGFQVFFGVSSSEPSPIDGEEVRSFLGIAKSDSGKKVVVSGYADPSGSAKMNFALAMERALAVKNWLAEQGVSPDQIVVSAIGEDNSSESYDQARRATVEFR